MKKQIFTVKDITEIAILVALAVVFDTFIKIPVQIAGGSINFSLVPLLVINLRHGPIKGFIASGIVFGLITCLIDGYGFIGYPMDYLIAFGSSAILGLFARKINQWFNEDFTGKLYAIIITILSVILAGIVRFYSSSFNGHFIYDYTWSAAFAYSMTYIPFTVLVNAVLITILLPTIMMLNKRFKTAYLRNNINNIKEETIESQ